MLTHEKAGGLGQESPYWMDARWDLILEPARFERYPNASQTLPFNCWVATTCSSIKAAVCCDNTLMQLLLTNELTESTTVIVLSDAARCPTALPALHSHRQIRSTFPAHKSVSSRRATRSTRLCFAVAVGSHPRRLLQAIHLQSLLFDTIDDMP